ncbi:hypothetical protein MPL3356_120075 [Mesorhizobium plurifarium]|uniref:Uncharacterized protein n=1 Tax=Mesorhizobium plurifarium TaxID=69974 RepID=A0A090DBA4_MESPL|nr:hypothetical protein MPL3356_120075 [Mesorhizobium plurifarium]
MIPVEENGQCRLELVPNKSLSFDERSQAGLVNTSGRAIDECRPPKAIKDYMRPGLQRWHYQTFDGIEMSGDVKRLLRQFAHRCYPTAPWIVVNTINDRAKGTFGLSGKAQEFKVAKSLR